jgi:hypothetical protein
MTMRGASGRTSVVGVEVADKAEPPSTAVAREEPAERGASRVMLPWLPLLVALPGLAAAASVLVQGWVPTTDHAFEVLRAAEVGSDHTPLTGSWSRLGWDHPGPLLFWVSAPGYRTFGPAGVAATVGVVHAAAAAGAVVAARRIGGAVLAALTAAVVGVISFAMGDWLVDPWNPYVGLLALLAGLLCGWAAAQGDGWLLIGAVVAGSWSVQAHVGYAPVVAAAALACTVAYLIRRRSGRRLGVRAVAAAVATAVVCWSGPLWDEIASPPGNLRALAAWARHDREGFIPRDVVLDQWGRHFGAPAPWMGADGRLSGVPGFDPDPALALRALAVVSLAAAAGVWAWRRRRPEPAWFIAYVVTLVAASALGLSRIEAPFFPYLALWTWSVAALVWVAAAWAVASALRADRGRRAVTIGATIVATGAKVLATVVAATAEGPFAAEGEVVESLSAQARDELERGPTYRLRTLDPGWHLVGTGLMADLRERGYDVRMSPRLGALKPHEQVDDRTAVPTLTVLTVTGTTPESPPAGARLVASRDTLSAAERAELDARARGVRTSAGLACTAELDLRTRGAVELAVAQGAEPDDAARVAALQRAGARTEVWLAPPGPDPPLPDPPACGTE